MVALAGTGAQAARDYFPISDNLVSGPEERPRRLTAPVGGGQAVMRVGSVRYEFRFISP